MVKMAIKIEINMTNKWLYSLMVIGIFLALGVGVWAYNSDMRVGNPPVMGHSAGEINVENSTVEIVSLQDALDSISNIVGGCTDVCNQASTSYLGVRFVWGAGYDDEDGGCNQHCSCDSGVKTIISSYYTYHASSPNPGGSSFAYTYLCIENSP